MRNKDHGTSACPCCNISPLERLEQLEPMIAHIGFAMAPGILELPSGEKTQFTYTVGLASHGFPEMVVVGVSTEQAVHSLGPAALSLLKGEIKTGVRDDSILHGLDVCFVPTSAEAFGPNMQLAKLRTGIDLESIQMVWPDSNNVFPWEKGFEEKFRSRQPILSQIDEPSPRAPAPVNDTGDSVPRSTPIMASSARDLSMLYGSKANSFLEAVHKPYRKLSS